MERLHVGHGSRVRCAVAAAPGLTIRGRFLSPRAACHVAIDDPRYVGQLWVPDRADRTKCPPRNSDHCPTFTEASFVRLTPAPRAAGRFWRSRWWPKDDTAFASGCRVPPTKTRFFVTQHCRAVRRFSLVLRLKG